MSFSEELAEIKRHISLKKDTNTGDIVLVGSPGGFFYALVRDIRPDNKKNWYEVSLTALVLPPVEFTWKLRYPQMCGELFTINGADHCMAAASFGADPTESSLSGPESISGQAGKLLQMAPRKQQG